MKVRIALPSRLAVWHPATLVTTCFGVGFLPLAPGTWGSLLGLPLAWWLATSFGNFGLLFVSLLVFLVGVFFCTILFFKGADGDPQSIVIDELVGQCLTLVVVIPDPVAYAAGFVLFRFFDIVKPWPVGWANRRIVGALGVMADDLFAAIYAAGTLYLIIRFLQ